MAAEAEPAVLSLEAENAAMDAETEEELEEEPVEVLILLCILHQHSAQAKTGKRDIWRRIAVPVNFSLLELHVALQNAFDWENAHLHSFTQPRSAPPPSAGGPPPPPFSGFGRTDVARQPRLDVDSLPESGVRNFLSVVGIKDAGFPELLTPAGGGGAGEAGSPAPGEEPLLYVQHSHPHAENPAAADPKALELFAAPKQVLEERAFRVSAVLTDGNPLLGYEYDFAVSHELTLILEGRHPATEGINYPTCLAGAGASRAEDGNDMADDGSLLPSYDYDEFAVLEVVKNFEKTYEGAWPAGPGVEDNTLLSRCYMCRYNRECARRKQCTGVCCDYCLKSTVAAQKTPGISLEEADALCDAAAAKVAESRRIWAQEGRCEWTEDDARPCVQCNEE